MSRLNLLFLFVLLIHSITPDPTTNSTNDNKTSTSDDINYNLLEGASIGDLNLVKNALASGADIATTKGYTKGVDLAWKTARDIAFEQTATWPRTNVFNNIVNAIEEHSKQLQVQAVNDKQATALNALNVVLQGTAIDALFHSVQIPSCNFTLAKHALDMDPNLGIHIAHISQLAASKISSSVDNWKGRLFGPTTWAEDNCKKIQDLLEEKMSSALHAERERLESIKQRREQRLEDKKHPSLVLLRESLSEFMGVESIYKQLKDIIITQAARRSLNPTQCNQKGRHNKAWILKGSPGTGKTSIARLITPVLKEAGIIPGAKNANNDFKEISKVEIKGVAVGQAEQKIQNMFTQYEGGVLFIDEAYLYDKDNDYEKKILDELHNELTKETTCEKQKLFIFAGYPKEMEEWMQFNPGFERRIDQRFIFPTPSSSTLAHMLVTHLAKQGLTIDADPKEFLNMLPTMIDKIYSVEDRQKHGFGLAIQFADKIFQTNAAENQGKLQIVSQKTVCKSAGLYRNDNCLFVENHPNLSIALKARNGGDGCSSSGSKARTAKDSKKADNSKNSNHTRTTLLQTKLNLDVLKNEKETTTKTDENLVTLLRTYLYSWCKHLLLTYTTSLVVQYLCYGILVLFVGYFTAKLIIFVWNAVSFLLNCLLWILNQCWQFFKNIWNKINRCCGGDEKNEFKTKEDPNADPFELARDCIRIKNGSVEEALEILWKLAPKDITLNEEQYRKSLTTLHHTIDGSKYHSETNQGDLQENSGNSKESLPP